MTRAGSASTRVAVGAAAGVLVGAAAGLVLDPAYAVAVGFDVAAAVFLGWTWAAVGRMDAPATARHAVQEDPTADLTRLIVLSACVASLGGVGVLLLRAGSDTGADRIAVALLGVAGVVVSWLVVHSVFTLHYARLYYAGGAEGGGGIDFGLPGPPRYTDFAYLAFTVGMTYQLSDTPVTTRALRASVLRHALLSYLFGTVVLGATVNLVVSLAG